MKRIVLFVLCVLVLPVGLGACQGSAASGGPMLSADYGYVELPEELLTGGGNATKRQEFRQREMRLSRLYTTGEFDQCAVELQKQLDRDPADTWSWYNLACVRVRQGKPDQAMTALSKAVDNGFCNLQRVQNDKDLSQLSDRRDFQALLQRDTQLQQARAQRIEKTIQQKLGGRYRTVVDDQCRVVFASNLDDQALVPVRQRLHAQALAQWNELFDFPIRQYVTVVVLDPSQTSKIPAGGGGWYDDNQHTILTVQTGIILTHEFTHALHHADQLARNQTHPVWVKEGLATLFETSQLKEGRLQPIHNFRLRSIQRLARQSEYIPLKRFMSMKQSEYMAQAGKCYPQGRYMMMYLHEKGLLKKWYDAYTAGFAQDRTGVRAMEQVCGKSIDQVDRDWRAWVVGLKASGNLPGDRDATGLRLMDGQLPTPAKAAMSGPINVSVEQPAKSAAAYRD